jgi:hypothetical protein
MTALIWSESDLSGAISTCTARAAIHLKSKQATINDFPSVVSE